MSSPELKKRNPSLNVQLNLMDTLVEPAINVAFVDGSKWNVDSAPFSAAQLRDSFYEEATRVEDVMEEMGDGDGFAADNGKKDGKKVVPAKGKK